MSTTLYVYFPASWDYFTQGLAWLEVHADSWPVNIWSYGLVLQGSDGNPGFTLVWQIAWSR